MHLQRSTYFACLLASLTLTLPAWGQGDTCQTATPISGYGDFPFDVTLASSSTGPCAIGNSTDQWFLWTANSSGDFLFRGGNASFFEGTDCNSLDLLQCFSGSFQLDGVMAGASYLIQIQNLGSFNQSGVLSITPPLCSDPAFYDEDLLEDNDSASTAIALAPGLYQDLFVAWDDPDYFEITVPPFHQVEVDVSSARGAFVSSLSFENGVLNREDGVTRYRLRLALPVPQTLLLRCGIGPSNPNFPEFRCTQYDVEITLTPSDPSFEQFCLPAEANSTLRTTLLEADYPSPNQLRLLAFGGRPQYWGIILVSDQFQDPGVATGSGFMCLSGNVARYNIAGTDRNSLGVFADSGGFIQPTQPGVPTGFMVPMDLPPPLGTITPGSTWHFQMWHRDRGPTTHFSNGLSVTF